MPSRRLRSTAQILSVFALVVVLASIGGVSGKQSGRGGGNKAAKAHKGTRSASEPSAPETPAPVATQSEPDHPDTPAPTAATPAADASAKTASTPTASSDGGEQYLAYLFDTTFDGTLYGCAFQGTQAGDTGWHTRLTWNHNSGYDKWVKVKVVRGAKQKKVSITEKKSHANALDEPRFFIGTPKKGAYKLIFYVGDSKSIEPTDRDTGALSPANLPKC